LGQGTVKVPARISGTGKIAIDIRFIRDLLATVKRKQGSRGEITMEGAMPSEPAVFSVGDYTEVVMPMFVQW
jgi:hypothetical protein